MTSACPWWIARRRRPEISNVHARLIAVLATVAMTRAMPLASWVAAPPRTRAAKRPRCRAVVTRPTPAKRITCWESWIRGAVMVVISLARSGRVGQRLREVVERRAVDRHGSEVLLHPRADLRRGAAATVLVAESPSATGEVVDLVVRDVLLELGERRAGVGAVEAADRHDGQLRAELETGRRLGSDCCGDPRVASGIGREGRDDCGARRRGVEQTAHAAATGATA